MNSQQNDVIHTADPRAGYLALKAEIDAAIGEVLAQPAYILGPVVARFETAFAEYCNIAHGIGVNSGTDAIHLSLRALGIGAGDEVITCSHTSVATIAAIVMTGATPVLVEVDPIYWTIDPSAVAAAVTVRTKAVVVVHLYGQPADLTSLGEICDRLSLALIEDCAQSHGATWHGRKAGSFGIASCFSFYPTKNLGSVGDGGMILTDDQTLAARLRMLRQYGWERPQNSIVPGWNSRLGPLQAAILQVKLKYLDRMVERRRAVADRYLTSFAGMPIRCHPERAGSRHARHLFVVRTATHEQRDALVVHLSKCGIAAGIHYPRPVHLQTGYASNVVYSDLTFTEALASTILSLPMYPEIAEAQQRRVVAAFEAFFGSAAR
jgi:dTDP-4-amino-4,6-dideoxygalactose transaminase